MLAPDVEAKPSIFQAPRLIGRDAVARWWSRMPALEGDVEARPLDFEAVGDCVLVRGYLRHRDGRTLSESQMPNARHRAARLLARGVERFVHELVGAHVVLAPD